MTFKTAMNDYLIHKKERAARRLERNSWGQKHENDKVQADDHTKINNYSEGFCYVCARRDLVLYTFMFICNSCYLKRGKKGLIKNIIEKKGEELCDICGIYRSDIYNHVWQRNVCVCHACSDRTERFHKKHRANITPYQRFLHKRYGNDVARLTGTEFA